MLFSLRLPLRFLRDNYTRLALTVVALALGVALVCAIDLVNRSVLRAFVEVIDTMAGRAALEVSAGDGGLFSEDLAQVIGHIPGVELALPVMTATAFTADQIGELLTIHGVDLTNDAAVQVYESQGRNALQLEDPLVFLNRPDSLVVTKSFAQRRGLSIGDPLLLDTGNGRRSFTVRGLLDPKGVARAYAANLVIMDLPAAQQNFGGEGLVTQIDVVVPAGQRPDHVAADIRKALPPGLKVEAPAQRRTDLNRVMQSLEIMLQAMGLVGLVAAFLIAFSRLTTVYDARTWQLGILRAGGVRSWALWRELTKEGLALGIAGVVLGVPVGVGVAHLLFPLIVKTVALNYKLATPEAELTIEPRPLAVAAVLGVGTAILAALVPARRAACVNAVETIRWRGIEQSGGSARLTWGIRAVTAGAIVAAVALQSATHVPVWGMAATALIAAGTAMAAQPLLAVFLYTCLPAMTLVAGPVGRFAVAMFARNLRRTALTAAVIGVGVGSILWLRTVAYSFEQSLIDALSVAYQGDLVVTSSHIAAGYVEAPMHDDLRFEVESLPGVAAAVGERLVDWHYAGGPIAIDAFDANYFVGGQFGRWRLLSAESLGVWDQTASGEAVLVSSNFALNLGVTNGSTIEVETPSGLARLRVAGVTVNFSSPRGTIVMSREVFKRLWRDTHVNRVFLRAQAGGNIAALRDQISRQLGRKYGLRVLSAAGLLDYFTEQVHQAFAPINALAALVLVVILVGVADTLAAGVTERVRELGAMRAIGARSRHLRRLILAEGFALGTLGLVLAIAAGIFLGALWVKSTFPYLLGWSLEIHVPFSDLFAVMFVTMVVCLLAALLPARHAAMLEPAAALRYE